MYALYVQAKIWDMSRCVLHHTLRGHSAAVFAVDMDADGKVAVTGSADRVSSADSFR